MKRLVLLLALLVPIGGLHAAEHTKGARPSTLAKHQAGQARRQNIPKAQRRLMEQGKWKGKTFGGGKKSKR